MGPQPDDFFHVCGVDIETAEKRWCEGYFADSIAHNLKKHTQTCVELAVLDKIQSFPSLEN